MRFAYACGGALVIAAASFVSPASSQAQTDELMNEIGMEFAEIPAGEFMMGCSPRDGNCQEGEEPLHRVRITRPFQMGRYEVTQAQWMALMEENRSAIVGDDHPVENVIRAEAQEFAERLDMLDDGYHYRLPTEAEWEYAARAGTTDPFYGRLEDIAWFGENSNDEHHPVGGKEPNAFGLYDMLGNVREWTSDTYWALYYAESPVDDPPGAPSNYGERGTPPYLGGAGVALPVIRGGGWPNPASSLRVSDRYHYYGPNLRVSDVGFRLVRVQAEP
jgi:formylglycine-generating enzyme required for sulfatase activity